MSLPGRLSIALCSALVGAALADTEWMTEREAIAQGEAALREKRWDDAIAAFAQSDKSYPAPSSDEAAGDGRSTRLARAIAAILAEIDASGAPAADKLPYWDFYIRSYPFYSASARPWASELWYTLNRYFVAAAEERLRQADPDGADERIALCRRIRDASPAQVLELLEGDWPEDHQDFGLCACHASVSLQHDYELKHERTWGAYCSRFRAAPYFAFAAATWGSFEGEPEVADPVARRLRALREGKPSALADRKDPFLPPDLLEAWATLSADSEEERQAAFARFAKTSHQRGGCPELGLVFFQIATRRLDGVWIEIEDAYERFLTEWKESSPGDPYRSWGVVWPYLRTWARPLRAEDMGVLRDLVEEYPAETIRPFAECVLAREAMLRGQGDEARSHYEAAVAFDPGGARLPGPFRAETAMEEARSRLIDFWAIRDPSRLGPLVRMELDTEGGLRQPIGCGNASSVRMAPSIRRTPDPAAKAGGLSHGIERYEGRLADECWVPNGYVFDYARVCFQAGEIGRLGRLAGRLDALAGEAKPRPGRSEPEYGARAALLRGCQKDAELVREKGLDAAIARLERSAPAFDLGRGDPDPFTNVDTAEALWALALVADQQGIDVACAERFSRPPDVLTLLLAAVGDSDRSVDYLLDLYLDLGEEEGGWRYTLASALSQRGPDTARRVMERIARDGVALWPAYRPLLERLSVEDTWRVCESMRGHEDEAVRDLAVLILTGLEERDPWVVYALKGK